MGQEEVTPVDRRPEALRIRDIYRPLNAAADSADDPLAEFLGAIPQAVIVFSACIFSASVAVVALRIAVFAVTGH